MTSAAHRSRRSALAAVLVLVAVGACGRDRGDARTDFDARIQDYMALHRRVASELPPPAASSDATTIETRRRAFASKLGPALAAADAPRVFTPAIATALRRRLATVLQGSDGKNVRGEILDANPAGLRVSPGVSYPETAPLSTVPSGVLAVLPALPEALEYRFVDHALILRDVEANVVVDVLPDAVA